MPLEKRKDCRLALEIGDKVTLKNIDGSFSTFIHYFDFAKEYLEPQMGMRFLLAKNNYENQVELNGEALPCTNKEYTVIGFAPRFFVVDRPIEDEELLILMDDKGNVFINENDIRNFKLPPKHVYVDDLKEVFGENIILHLDEGDFEI